MRTAWVDAGFKNAVADHGAGLGITVTTVQPGPGTKGFVPVPKRWVAEQTFGTTMLHRRLARDYEKLPASSQAPPVLGGHRPDDAAADRRHHPLARHPSPGLKCGRVSGEPPTPVPDQLLRRLADDRDAARARVERLTAELTDARQQLERLEVTHQMLLELAGAAGPPLPPAYRDILAVLADHPGGLRTKDVSLALNLPT